MAVTSTSNVVSPQAVNTPSANALLSTAMTSTKAFDGTEAVGTAMVLLYTAGASGSKVPQFINIQYSGTNGAAPSGTTTATVVRFWANNGTANTSATNNIYLGSITIPAQLYNNSAALPDFQFPLSSKMASLPGSWKIYAGTSVAVGGTACALALSAGGGGDL